jgi:trehalose synthase
MKAALTSVELEGAPISRFRPLLEDDVWSEFESLIRELSTSLRGRILWNINSTAQGGGVAELLSSLIPYDRGAGIDERWLVIEGSPEFFAVTKRIHNLLHGVPSEGSVISDDERQDYERTIAANAAALVEVIKPGDVVIIHDPQAAGLVPPLAHHGAVVIWRSHVGVDEPNDVARSAWNFLRPYLDLASAYVFSRQRYAWEGLDPSRVKVIAPTIDPFSVKNLDMNDESVERILRAAGIVAGTGGDATFERFDGTTGRVVHPAGLTGVSLPPDASVIVQVSRWDGLKDPVGVLDTFVHHVAPRTDSWLTLAGPEVKSVADDPEQPQVLGEISQRLEQLEPSIRRRVQLAQLPMDDPEENAAIVNALQRRADVVVQKSLAEGFGLTVSEAMWKARPIVASRVGGIEDQIEDGISGVLVDDPKDLRAFGDAIVRLLNDRAEAMRLGSGARRRAARNYLAPRHLSEQAQLILNVIP